MKLLHVGDLHIGKRVKGFSLFEDQMHILSQIIETIKENKIDGIIIAGDIYDISNPSGEAISCFDKFISEIHSLNVSCYAVSGNHDSVYRIAFASDIMAREKIYFAKKYSGTIKPIKIDENINIWLLPFIRPADVREYHPDFEAGSYEDMARAVIENLSIDVKKINILIAHQFVTHNGTKPEISESETISLGTLDNIDVSVFDKFDYVALGHIHKPQAIGRKTARYAGSPLKYSFSEKNDIKSMVLIDIKDKNLKIDLIPYKPLRDMKEYVGTYEELLKHPKTSDYARIVLKDENYITDIKHKLENNFLNIMEIVYDNSYTRKNNTTDKVQMFQKQSPIDLFEKFYEIQNNKKLDCEQTKIIQDIFEEIKEAIQ